MAGEPTIRVELDMEAVVTQYKRIQSDNFHSVEEMAAMAFNTGDVVTIHIIVESTGLHREQCDFVDLASQYRSKCGQVLFADGTCRFAAQHAEKTHQLELADAEGK